MSERQRTTKYNWWFVRYKRMRLYSVNIIAQELGCHTTTVISTAMRGGVQLMYVCGGKVRYYLVDWTGRKLILLLVANKKLCKVLNKTPEQYLPLPPALCGYSPGCAAQILGVDTRSLYYWLDEIRQPVHCYRTLSKDAVGAYIPIKQLMLMAKVLPYADGMCKIRAFNYFRRFDRTAAVDVLKLKTASEITRYRQNYWRLKNEEV